MLRISINLLPVEFGAQEVKRAKFYKIQVVGVAVILLMVFLSSLTVALRILQSQNISQIQNKITASEQKISDLKNTQGSLLLLKDRLTTINQYLEIPSKQAQMYKLTTELLPATVSISSISVDKSGDISLLLTIEDVNSLENLTEDLLSKERNQDKISQVSLESLNRGRDGAYRLNFKIKAR